MTYSPISDPKEMERLRSFWSPQINPTDEEFKTLIVHATHVSEILVEIFLSQERELSELNATKPLAKESFGDSV